MQKNQTIRMRSNSFTGFVEDKFEEFDMHFTEFWSGEGLDFTLKIGKNSRQQSFYLTSNALTWVAAAALATGMIELPEVKEKAEQLLPD